MKATSIAVCFADKKDIDRIIEIERSWLHLSHWSIEAYHRLLDDETFTTSLVAKIENLGEENANLKNIIGFAVFHATNVSAEIYNIAVERSHARLGVGTALMKGVVELSRSDGARKLMLEVRKSNTNAISFYKRFQFHIIGERLNYYSSPVEDAYVMEKDLRL